MAQFRLIDYIDAGTQSYHTYTSWKVTRDVYGDDIIDYSIRDPDNLMTWASPLPDGNGGFHGDLPLLHLWIRVHTLESDSEWSRVDSINQNNQTISITRNGVEVNVLNTITAGIQ